MNAQIDKILLNALNEDIGNGDVTSSALIPDKHASSASLVAKGDFVVAGLPFAERTFHLIDRNIKFKVLKKEGSRVRKGSVIAGIRGNTKSLLMAERTALNLLQRLSGIATLTSAYVQAVKGTKVRIIDTRKTAPGLRWFDKYAVRAGGGGNHRFGLYDGVLIKDNHIAAVGGVKKAVKLAASGAHHLLKIEIEVNNISEVREAVSAGADVIMLDNMPTEKIKKAVEIIRGRTSAVIESSGNINLDNIQEIAQTGVDVISVGAITHSAPAADISMRFNSLK